MSPHESGRRRYAERGAADTLRQIDRVPAVGHERASDQRVRISGPEADLLIARSIARELADALAACLAVMPVPNREDGEIAGARRLALAAIDKHQEAMP